LTDDDFGLSSIQKCKDSSGLEQCSVVSFVRPASVCEHSAFKTQVRRIILGHKIVVHEHSAMNDHGFDLCLDWQTVVKHCDTVVL